MDQRLLPLPENTALRDLPLSHRKELRCLLLTSDSSLMSVAAADFSSDWPSRRPMWDPDAAQACSCAGYSLTCLPAIRTSFTVTSCMQIFQQLLAAHCHASMQQHPAAERHVRQAQRALLIPRQAVHGFKAGPAWSSSTVSMMDLSKGEFGPFITSRVRPDQCIAVCIGPFLIPPISSAVRNLPEACHVIWQAVFTPMRLHKREFSYHLGEGGLREAIKVVWNEYCGSGAAAARKVAFADSKQLDDW